MSNILFGNKVAPKVIEELEARSLQLANPTKSNWVTQRQVWFQLTSMAEVISDKAKTFNTNNNAYNLNNKPFTEDQAIALAENNPSEAASYWASLTPNERNQLQDTFNVDVDASRGIVKSRTVKAQKIIKSVPTDFRSIGGLYDGSNLRPKEPAVTNIKVTKQGELGTTRKATIELTFFSQQQFDEYEPYLFIPGISIRLEWGWSVGASLSSQRRLASDYMVDAIASNEILKRSRENPNYDGFQGRVVNFSYQLDGDVWKGSVEIVSAGSNLIEKPIDDTSCNCSCKREDPDGEKKEDQSTENIPTFWYALHEEPNEGIQEVKSKLKNVFGYEPDIYLVKFAGRDRNAEGEEIGKGEGGEFFTEETFMSLNTMADLINRFSGYLGLDNEPADGKLVFEKDGKPITIPAFSDIISVDPYVCILPGQVTKVVQNNPEVDEAINDNRGWWRKNSYGLAGVTGLAVTTGLLGEQAKKNTDLFRVNPESRVEDYIPQTKPSNDPNKQIVEIIPLTPPKNFLADDIGRSLREVQTSAEDRLNGNIETQPEEDSDPQVRGYIGNILINTRHALKVFKENKKLNSFMLALLKDVNECCGEFWEFDFADITLDDKDNKKKTKTQLITIVDTKDAKRKIGKDPNYPLEINALPNQYDKPTKMSIARSIDLKTKLTDGMKTQALYADGAATGASGGPCSNRFTYIALDKNSKKAVENRGNPTRKLPDTGSCPKTKDCDNEQKSPREAFFKALGSVLFKRTDKRAAAAKVAYKKYIASINNDNLKNIYNTQQQCPTIPYPFELSIGLDGIGGFKWGDYITTNRLPSRYKILQEGSTFVWQVTTVEHDISPNDWKTNIQTILRYLGST